MNEKTRKRVRFSISSGYFIGMGMARSAVNQAHVRTVAAPSLFRAVQISGMVDSVALILLDKLVPRPVMSKSGWVAERQSAAPTVLGIILHRCPSPSGLG
jgi:hypothetical protein